MAPDVAPVCLAVAGAGIFARSAWAPVLRAAEADGAVILTSVWSRSPSPAAALAADLGPHVRPTSGDDGLATLLADPATDAVLVVLPVQAMPAVVTAALAAGKAVLQEKPVAPTVEAATAVAAAALAARRAAGAAPSPPAVLPVWALAENYRSEPGVAAAAAAARPAAIGPAVKADLVANMPMDSANRYHRSSWRRDTAGCPGGFLMDSSVHFMAALRAVTGRGGAGWGEAVSASATAYGADGEDGRGRGGGAVPLPAPDTLVGRLAYGSGRAASVSITFAGAVPALSVGVEGRDGAVQLARGGLGALAGGRAPGGGGCAARRDAAAARGAGYDLTTAARTGAGLAASSAFHPFAGLERELRAFTRLVRGAGGRGDAAALCPAAAARDLAAVEALLASAAAGGGAPVPVLPLAAVPWGALQAEEEEEE